MLYCMSAFMCSHCSCHDAPAVIDIAAQVDRTVHRIVVVGEFTLHAGDLHVTDAVTLEHAACNLIPGTAVTGRNLGVFVELAFQVTLH